MRAPPWSWATPTSTCAASCTSANRTTGSRSWTPSPPSWASAAGVFLVELSEAARPILGGLAQAPAGPPPKLAPVLRHGIAPGEVSDDAVPEHLRTAGLTVLDCGELPLATAEFAPDDHRIELPSTWFVAGRTR